MLAYKILENPNLPGLVGRLFIPFQTYVMLCATPTEPQFFWDKWTVERMKEKGFLQEIDLLEERRLHHHLYKPIKLEVERLLAS